MRTRLPRLAVALALSTVSTGVGAQPSTPAARPRPAEPEGPLLRIEIPGEAQLRYTGLTDIHLATTP